MEKFPAIVEKLLAPLETEQDIAVPAELNPDDVLDVLVFHLAAETYAIPIEHVLEITRFVEATEVPHTVEFLEGIISLRGEMIPVINGRQRMGHEPKGPDKKTRIVILQEEAGRFGIMVDMATHVVRLLKENIEAPPPVVGPGADFIDGVYQLKGQLLILLNLKRFLEFA